MEIGGVEAKGLTELHGELIAYGWIGQRLDMRLRTSNNSGNLTPEVMGSLTYS